MKGQQLLVLSLLKNTFSYRLIRGYSYQLSPTDTISLIRKIVSFWYRLLRTDTQINFQKKNPQSGSEPARRKSKLQGRRSPSATQRGRRSHRPSLQVEVASPRSAVGPDPTLPPSNPDWILTSVGVGVLTAVVEGVAPCPPAMEEGRRG
jgi:hypothetical protein